MTTLAESQGLIAELAAKQRADGLSDAEMARRLGIARSYWTQFRLGRRRDVTARVLRGIVQGFPEMTARALLFLSSDVPNCPSKADD